jgi:hypothetical protein
MLGAERELVKRGFHCRTFTIAVGDPDVSVLSGVRAVADKDEELSDRGSFVPDALVTEWTVPLRIDENNQACATEHLPERDPLRS